MATIGNTACMIENDRESFTIRALNTSEWEGLRDFRLHALRSAPGVFGSTYEKEAAYTPEEWRDWLSQDGKCVFGLFDGDRMIGLTGIFLDHDDPTGETAMLAASFIEPAYRGRGLSHMLYDARLQWAVAQPRIRKLVLTHRADNEASRRANRAFGFRVTGRRTKVWPDGVEEEQIACELRLDQLRLKVV